MENLLSPIPGIDDKEFISRLSTLGDFLRANLIGQEEVITAVTDLLCRAFCRMRFDEQPIASILLPGPTGTGKTLLADLCNQHLFRTRSLLMRLDMSEYSTPSSVDRLIGDKDIGLFESSYRKSFCRGVLLFDELEKAEARV